MMNIDFYAVPLRMFSPSCCCWQMYSISISGWMDDGDRRVSEALC